MKIRVYDSDGVFRGGLMRIDHLVLTCRTWRGAPHPHFDELMVDYSGHGEPSYEGSWFLLQLTKNERPSSAADPDSEFDATSQAIRLTPPEALRWFKNHVYETPPDLIALARAHKRDGMGVDGEEKRTDAFAALTPHQKKIWDLLEGKAMLAKEIAKSIYGKPGSATAVRKHIETIKRTGRTIANARMQGYYRPDAPPPDLETSSNASAVADRQSERQTE